MFYVLSKSLDLLAAPLTWALLLVLAGAWGAHRGRTKLALRAPLAAAAILYVFSVSPVANGIARALEASATTTLSPTKTYDVVVVLGGILNDSSTPSTPEFSEAVDRIIAGYDIIRHDRARYILLTSDTHEAHALAKQLVDWGVDPARIVLEEHSRNTRENALESAKIIHDRGWSEVLLVTSALHMPRAAGAFRAADVTFDTLAVDRLAATPEQSKGARLDPRADALNLSTTALREAVGRLVYRIMGYSHPQ